MEIEPLVTPLVVGADASESLAVAARRLWAHEIGALPVFQGESLVGIVTERDLVAAMALGAALDGPIRAHMTPLPATAAPAEDSAVVAGRMVELGIRHLPVVRAGRVVGMVSASDLLALVAWPERRRLAPSA